MCIKIESKGEQYEAQVVCDGCGAKAPSTVRQTRERAKEAAQNRAWSADFVPYQHEWKCAKCRALAWPDSFKIDAAEYCRRLGVPVPVPAEQEPPKPKRRRKKKKEEVTA